jgi:hypothetical protein
VRCKLALDVLDRHHTELLAIDRHFADFIGARDVQYQLLNELNRRQSVR